MKTKKFSSVLSIVLALTLVIGLINPVSTSAEEAKKLIVWVAVDSLGEKNETDNEVVLDKTAVLVNDGDTAEDAIKSALENNKIELDASSSDYGTFINGIGGVATPSDYSKYWNFCVNNTVAEVGISGYTLSNGDEISLLFEGYPTEYTEAECFTNKEKSIDVDKEKEVVNQATKANGIIEDATYQKYYADFTPGITDDLKPVVDLIRAGYDNPDFYNKVFKKVDKALKEIAHYGATKYSIVGYSGETEDAVLTLSSLRISDLAKLVMFITACGRDAADINGLNLIPYLTDKAKYEKEVNGEQYYSAYSVAGMILLALDCANYQIPDDEYDIEKFPKGFVTKKKLVEDLVADMDKQIDIAVQWSSPDGAAMTVTPLAPYLSKEKYDELGMDISYEELLDKVEFIFDYLAKAQSNKNGGYAGFGTDSNPWTLAQCMTAFAVCGIDGLGIESSERGLIKNGHTFLENAASFVDFKIESEPLVNEDLMSFDPTQLVMGISASLRAYYGESSFYDMLNAENIVEDYDGVLDDPNPSEGNPDDTGKTTPTVPTQGAVAKPVTVATTPAVTTAVKATGLGNTKTLKLSSTSFSLKAGKSKKVTYKVTKVDSSKDADKVSVKVAKKFKKYVKVTHKAKKKTITIKLKKNAKKLSKGTVIKITVTSGAVSKKIKVKVK